MNVQNVKKVIFLSMRIGQNVTMKLKKKNITLKKMELYIIHVIKI